MVPEPKPKRQNDILMDSVKYFPMSKNYSPSSFKIKVVYTASSSSNKIIMWFNFNIFLIFYIVNQLSKKLIYFC